MSCPTTTWDWISSVPLANSAGTTVYGWYDGVKNRCSLTNYALTKVETAVKVAAGVTQPVVKKVEGKLTAADAYTLEKLRALEDKYPSIKKPTEEVISDTKGMVKGAWKAGADRVSSLPGAGVVATSYNTGKTVVVAGATKAKATYDGTVKVISDGYTGSKQKLSNGYTSGKGYIVGRVTAGSTYIADSRAGQLVGSGVFRALGKADSVVEYVLPEEKEEGEGEEEQTSPPTPTAAEAPEEVEAITNLQLAKKLSRKVRVRVYHKTVNRLHNLQGYYKDLLYLVKSNTDLLRLAQAIQEAPAKGYHSVEALVKDLFGKEKKVESDVEDSLSWLRESPNKWNAQNVLDRTKELAGRLVSAARSVASSVAYLPSGMKDGATKALHQATSLLETLKQANVPSDLPKATLAIIAELIEKQINFVNRLGHQVSSTLSAYLGRDTCLEETSPSDLPSAEEPQDDDIVPSDDNDDGDDDDDDDEGFGDPTGEEHN